ncbi:hypothetical protein COW94_03100 [Candidatus Peregrinibacteria bacterium CG22_combo_CG10-13_8_21_14_all_44_10]|nr:MAG: hypothetical protein AUK45_02325 [Candidatus Peregrinibacteria bacterium CG2_30_44_17]PIP66175.1 MAG: hypothetical protein COW94_03100 [Candidatus Peregrinibacteria bacterium CG22_combo_CG10-13_8_21_14_all_44_10]PIS03902.1 MAG: hypothetical protein COT83_03610 [Candidatus Peregrinibacteria bacterium CG10_big_fil_rev_8_21_14_0_10_44_7]PIX79997.1 MAG: hypothetical protein COZ35_02095 [Candidatus Peregrinibacteria bacterium CG_4_10_14_3_um_filter_44_21]PJB88978.1 MAG: hypothetical protein 
MEARDRSVESVGKLGAVLLVMAGTFVGCGDSRDGGSMSYDRRDICVDVAVGMTNLDPAHATVSGACFLDDECAKSFLADLQDDFRSRAYIETVCPDMRLGM